MQKEIIGNCVLYCGDALDIMPSLKKVDAVISDPPFGTTQCKWDSVIDMPEMWRCIDIVSRDNTAIVLNAQTPFDKVLGASNLDMLKYEWIWEKLNATGHLNSSKMPLKAHENILVFYKTLPTYNPQKTSGHVLKTATKRVIDSECYGKTTKTTNYASTDRFPRSVQVFSSDKQVSNLHPTQKPLKLQKYITKTYTNRGDTVLDFCMGSGTEGNACVDLDRIFIGIEKMQKHFDTACWRIEKAYKTKPRLFDNISTIKANSGNLFCQAPWLITTEFLSGPQQNLLKRK